MIKKLYTKDFLDFYSAFADNTIKKDVAKGERDHEHSDGFSFRGKRTRAIKRASMGSV